MRLSALKPRYTPCLKGEVKQVQFSVISSQQIEKNSVIEINESKLYEKGQRTKNSPNDPRLGITSLSQICQTCGQSSQCQGHFGHIKLIEPILHYGFLNEIVKILKCVCHHCFKVRRPKTQQKILKFRAISKIQSPKIRLNLFAELLSKLSTCSELNGEEQSKNPNFKYKGCGRQSPTSIYTKNYQIYFSEKKKLGDRKQLKIIRINRNRIKAILQRFSLYNEECELLGFKITKPIDLMIQNLLVIPPQSRPSIAMHNETHLEDDITKAYCKIINFNKDLKQNKISDIQKEQIIDQIEQLAGSIMFKLNSTKINKVSTLSKKKKKKTHNFKSITQRLKGKQGRFRQNLMGKRVDFSARTVISPDPNLSLNQIGIPTKVANTLTFPQEVNQLNYEKILDLCEQGQVKTFIKPHNQCLRDENHVINVLKIEPYTRQQISKYLSFGMIAQRVLMNGDYVLLNRQPTLHRMSMMSHRVRILPYSTFRINLSVCPPYNADFDGDEMNIHVPQSYQTLAQLKNISDVNQQIVAPRNSSPAMGIVQDALLAIHLFTLRDTFLNKEQTMNLLMWGTSCTFKKVNDLPAPAIIKPQVFWTGKQILSVVLPKNISTKLFKNRTEGYSNQSDTNILIKNGLLVTGSMQKDLIGSGVGSLIHSIWLQNGPQEACDFITNTERIANNWMIDQGFSIGASDIVQNLAVQQFNKKQKESVNKMYFQIFNKYLDPKIVKDESLHQKGYSIKDSFEFNVNTHLNSRMGKAHQQIHKSLSFAENNIYKIIQSKSKGSETNLAQILFSVGNQNIEGKRCPQGFVRRGLPHFHKDDNSPQSRGYVYSSFYQGLKPHEFFFHSMGGREGLSDTGIKTSHVGYLQRKLVKSLQDIIVKYDGSVRDSKDNFIQKCYGQDGFLCQFLEKQRIPGIQLSKQQFRKNYRWSEQELKKYNYSEKSILTLKHQYNQLYHYKKAVRLIFAKEKQLTSIENYFPIKIERIINKLKNSEIQNKNKKQTIDPLFIYQSVQNLINQCIPPYFKELHDSLENFSDQFSDQDMSENYHQKDDFAFLKKEKLHFSFDKQIGLYLFKVYLRFTLASKKLCSKINMKKQTLIELLAQIKNKFNRALASAGEAVGPLAAQSIGQPTTQMTLNTFHLAGVSDKNITLGLPRLQQLLNLTEHISTPSMKIFPKKKVKYSQRTSLQNQMYLLDLLTYHLPEKKMSDYLISSRISYNFEVENPDYTQIGTNNLPFFKKRSPWSINFLFNKKNIGSKRSWIELMDKVQVLSKNYSCQTIEINQFSDQFNNENTQNPCILVRFLQNKVIDFDFYQDCNQETAEKQINTIEKQQKQFNKKIPFNIRTNSIFKHLQKLQAQLKQLSICGVKGIKKVKTTKKLSLNIPLQLRLNLDQKLKQSYEQTIFQTSGSNLRQCLSHAEVDCTRTYSNNVVQIYNILGIQAARQAFIRQFMLVLSPYGISVNFHHLSILVDWIFMRGKMTAINRYGLNRSKDVSTFAKASYEEASKVLFNAALFSQKDHLKGVTQRLIFGQTVRGGTTICKVLLNPTLAGKYQSKGQKHCKILKLGAYGGKRLTGMNTLNYCKTPQQYSPTRDSILYNINLNQSPFRSQNTADIHFSPLHTQLRGMESPIFHRSPIYHNNSPGYGVGSVRSGFSPSYSQIKPSTPIYSSSFVSPMYLTKQQIVNPRKQEANYSKVEEDNQEDSEF